MYFRTSSSIPCAGGGGTGAVTGYDVPVAKWTGVGSVDSGGSVDIGGSVGGGAM